MYDSFMALLALAAFASALPENAFLKSRPVREWSREETQAFLRDSPWVRRLSVGPALLEWQPPEIIAETREGRGEPRSRAARVETPPGVAGRRWQAETTYYIEWSSAKILRQAGAHFTALKTGAAEEETEPMPLPFYVLTVGGADLTAFDGIGEAHLAASTYLRPRRGKVKVHPVEVRIRKAEDGHLVSLEFAFPREVDGRRTISDEEGSVRFWCKGRDVTLRTTFDLTHMATAEGRDL